MKTLYGTGNNLWILIIFISLLQCTRIQAQNKGLWEFGVASGYGRTFTTANFLEIPGMIPYQGNSLFTTAEGSHFSAEVKSTLRIISMFKTGIKLGFSSSSSIFTRTTPTIINPNATPIQAEIIDSLSTFLTSIFASPYLQFEPIEHLAISAGLTLETMAASQFTQTQNIIDSTGGRLSIEIHQTGTIPNPNTTVLGWIQLSGRMPLNHEHSFYLEPQIRANFGISQQFIALNWKANSFSAGLGLVYQPQPIIKITTDTIYIRDTITTRDKSITSTRLDLEKSEITAQETIETSSEIRKRITINQTFNRKIPKPLGLLSLTCPVTFVLKDKTESKSVKLTVDEIITNHYSTLLPSVFFAENSSEIPARYHLTKLPREHTFSTLDIYYSLLPILGERLLLYPETNLQIIGCNDNSNESIEISKRRASVIQRYFMDKYGIPASRLEITSRNLPENASQSGEILAAEENRRVDFKTDSEKLLEPLLLPDTTRIADPPIIRFRPNVVAESGIESWKLELLQTNQLIREFSGTEDIPSPLDWEINAEKSVKKLTENPIEYRLTVYDQDKQSQEVSGTIKFSEKKQQRENILAEQLNDHFSLMCFDYDEVKLTKANSNQLDIIRKIISQDATITIIGSTDAIGKEDYNIELSLRRAKAIAKALKTPKAKIIGAGKDNKTFPNNLPEGRIYSRRVDIRIEKKSK